MKDLKKIVKNIQEKLKQKVDSLNSGGCIHFAYYFSDVLTVLGIDHKVYYFNKSWDGPVSRSYRDFEAVSHVMVYIDDIGYIDGYKTLSLKEVKNVYSYKSTHKFDLHRLRSKYPWNYTYNKRQNSKVKNVILECFNDYTG